ncbi:unnamed protein product [Spirodela intermedia]|uniref:U-box domain-containing protein n=1 Tax=Spirodela intermedia TaxID=51605 RepID=A0A7I8KUC5_SPIIN|nr:unnamed protein product [Spirodela intermedia]
MTRRSGRKSSFGVRALVGLQGGELTVPAHFRCPISLELMKDPVTLPTGITYDRRNIEAWLEAGHETCPVTKRLVAGGQDLTPNHTIRRLIQDWCVANRKYGVERIPTPRIPTSAAEVAGILSELAAASQRGEVPRCLELVGRIRCLAGESERNRRCIVSNGAAAVLSAAFAAFSRVNAGRPAEVEEEILAALAGMFPLGAESRSQLAAPESLRSLVGIVSNGDLTGRLNAVQVVKELVHTDVALVGAVADAEGMAEALVKLIREPISSQVTKSSLVAIFYMVSSREATASRFAAMGLVPVLLDALVDCDKSTTEKITGVLDGLCGCRRGRQAAYHHALTTPVLVKKILRVSVMTTEFSVSILWKLCKNSDREAETGEGCLAEALQVGAFQKLLLLLQVGCGEATKEKASELLKLLNASRLKPECIDSADFKALKRPF